MQRNSAEFRLEEIQLFFSNFTLGFKKHFKEMKSLLKPVEFCIIKKFYWFFMKKILKKLFSLIRVIESKFLGSRSKD